MSENKKKTLDFDLLKKRIDTSSYPVCRGRVTGVTDLCIEAVLPGARVGTRVLIETRLGAIAKAETASLDGSRVKLLALSQLSGVGPGDLVTALSDADEIMCGPGLLGRIIDSEANPLDGGPPIVVSKPWQVQRPAPDPLTRKSVNEQLVTQVRAIDGCLSLGLGQRIGLFAGPGLGKSTLLGDLARRSKSDVSVICLVGERGREVRDFLDNKLGPSGLQKSIVILASADAPPLVRARSVVVATAVAEWFRAEGKDVLLLVDSLTRAIRARRDAALALGEPPVRAGFPASAFSALPSLLERAGCDKQGSITAVYAVLTEDGNSDPIADEARSLLDGHIILSKKSARAGRWPAIDIVRSVSRVMDSITKRDQLNNAAKLRRMLAAYEENEDLILMGAYRRGTSPDTDLFLDRKLEIDAFLKQERDELSPIEDTLKSLSRITK